MVKIVKLENNSIRAIIIAIMLFLIFTILADIFGIIPIPEYAKLIFSILTPVLIFLEVGLVKTFAKNKKKGLDLFSAIGVVAGIVLLVTIGLEVLPITAPAWIMAVVGIKAIALIGVTIDLAIETFIR